ncbi:MAG TPA: AraC family transcriptional regulator [Burkholderiaceae bacterium]|nr:AraC family transcriptional regulator [Burkholderiaceae bacterium]
MSARTFHSIAAIGLALLVHSVPAADTPATAMPVPAANVNATPLPTAQAPATPTTSAPAAAQPAAAARAALGAKDSAAVAVAPAAAPASLDNRIQELKGDVIKLNRDLLVLEEELLFPANTQVAVFVSMDVGKMFELDSVQIKLDDKIVTNYLYTPLEVQALHRGGVQRAYLGNLKAGPHEIVAFFTGGGPHYRDYKRGTTIKFDKGTDPKYIELRIKDSTGKLQPEFDVKVWQ